MKSFFRIFFTSFLLFAFFNFSSCSNEKDKEYQKMIKKAEILKKEHRFEEAKNYYLKAQNLKKENIISEKIIGLDKLIVQQKDSLYKEMILKGDDFFNKKLYKKANEYYTKAQKLKPSENYPNTMLEKINPNNFSDSSTVANVSSRKKYHAIVGSYKLEENAIKRKQKLSLRYPETSILISSWNGNYLVSIKPFKSIHKAYNFIYIEDDKLDDKTIWVYSE